MKKMWFNRFGAVFLAAALILTTQSPGYASVAFATNITAVQSQTEGYEFGELVGTPSDYSNPDNWYQIPDITKKVDTFYIYPTSYIDLDKDAPLICGIDNPDMREGVVGSYQASGEIFEESTNVFAPYYRHTNLKAAIGMTTSEYLKFQTQEQRTDIYAALDYYFEHYNNGRPFILAGHSQGSAMTKIVVMEYMRMHPEYYSRMIAAYVVGFAVTKDDLDKHPHLKFAEGESDYGVVLSWNTEGTANSGAQNIVVDNNSVSINPLNWKRDATYAPATLNLGSRMRDSSTHEYVITQPGYADAYVNTDRGVVLTNSTKDHYIHVRGFDDLFGPASYHNGDYGLYYYNIRDNIAKRIGAYLLDHNDYKIKSTGKKLTDYSRESNWINIPKIKKDVDTFYLYPASYLTYGKSSAPKYSGSRNKDMRKNAAENFAEYSPAFSDYTNVFAPYYSQASIPALANAKNNGYNVLSKDPRTDVYTALDYYFKHYNQGRPFILAGHSQGSMMIRMILRDYMQEHPDYYKRMVAAYAIGYSITQDDLDAHPYLRFAEGASDTGVIVSWNTEGKGNKDSQLVLKNAISINPINWRRDEVKASASENMGSVITSASGKTSVKKPGVADARVDTARGVVICSNKKYPYSDTSALLNGKQVFGKKSFHRYDYGFYFYNIKDNVKTRIEAWKAKN